ncbi:MAG TPA: D-alanyl-D-alanine carboxypeptidase, partial [Candidatus Merdenecus merdavium]|nr:D-alanyl-D-alanine carboxypeptidase [Candidatus Merdenecus merdavium]
MAFVLTFLSLPSYIVVAENINTTERETTGEEIKKEDGQDQESLLDGDQPVTSAEAGVSVSVDAPSAILMEASTGQVIFEKEADTPLRPASITKIMTLILIFDALESGKIKLTDEVV